MDLLEGREVGADVALRDLFDVGRVELGHEVMLAADGGLDAVHVARAHLAYDHVHARVVLVFLLFGLLGTLVLHQSLLHGVVGLVRQLHLGVDGGPAAGHPVRR